MFKRILPQQTDFFQFFEEHAELTVTAGRKLAQIFNEQVDIDAVNGEIVELEHKADTVTHRCIHALQRTFITPFDRSQIHSLICDLDDVMDSIHTAAMRMSIYQVKDFPEEATLLSNTIAQATVAVFEAVRCLRNVSDDRAFTKVSISIHRFEDEGDELLRRGLRTLFAERKDPLLVIQWKEILELLESTTNRCEDVADIVQSVILEAS